MVQKLPPFACPYFFISVASLAYAFYAANLVRSSRITFQPALYRSTKQTGETQRRTQKPKLCENRVVPGSFLHSLQFSPSLSVLPPGISCILSRLTHAFSVFFLIALYRLLSVNPVPSHSHPHLATHTQSHTLRCTQTFVDSTRLPPELLKPHGGGGVTRMRLHH